MTMVVNTLPRVKVTGLKLYKGQHNILPADCPQGILKVRIQGATKKREVKVRVTQKGKTETLNVQDIDQIQRYIVGDYDLEILTLPRIYKSVKITQSGREYVDIPGSGQLKYKTFKAIVGQIFLVTGSDDSTSEWVVDLDDSKLQGRFYLQPGRYKIVYRQKDAISTDYTKVKFFTIRSGADTDLVL